jgi:hypothetical protein
MTDTIVIHEPFYDIDSDGEEVPFDENVDLHHRDEMGIKVVVKDSLPELEDKLKGTLLSNDKDFNAALWFDVNEKIEEQLDQLLEVAKGEEFFNGLWSRYVSSLSCEVWDLMLLYKKYSPLKDMLYHSIVVAAEGETRRNGIEALVGLLIKSGGVGMEELRIWFMNHVKEEKCPLRDRLEGFSRTLLSTRVAEKDWDYQLQLWLEYQGCLPTDLDEQYMLCDTEMCAEACYSGNLRLVKEILSTHHANEFYYESSDDLYPLTLLGYLLLNHTRKPEDQHVIEMVLVYIFSLDEFNVHQVSEITLPVAEETQPKFKFEKITTSPWEYELTPRKLKYKCTIPDYVHKLVVEKKRK